MAVRIKHDTSIPCGSLRIRRSRRQSEVIIISCTFLKSVSFDNISQVGTRWISAPLPLYSALSLPHNQCVFRCVLHYFSVNKRVRAFVRDSLVRDTAEKGKRKRDEKKTRVCVTSLSVPVSPYSSVLFSLASPEYVIFLRNAISGRSTRMTSVSRTRMGKEFRSKPPSEWLTIIPSVSCGLRRRPGNSNDPNLVRNGTSEMRIVCSSLQLRVVWLCYALDGRQTLVHRSSWLSRV